jgi:nucleoside-diphosphate-sugar epimerase
LKRLSDDVILLTGATGLLGHYLLRDLLLREAPLAVLVRPNGGETAPARLARLVAHWEEQLGRRLPRPHCLEGDLATPGLALDAEASRWTTRHCRQVLHNGASLTFHGKDRRQDPWRTNVDGTANVLAFCRQARVRSFHYVSTAYVCGKRTGTVFEDDLEWGGEFRNDYEASKAEAERLVRSARYPDRLTVYRPAVIVGDSATGYTSTYHGLYAYFQFVWILSQYARRDPDGRWHAPVRLNITGQELRNLIPVDWCSAVIAHLVCDPVHHGRTYHLTPTRAVTASVLEEAIATYFKYYGTTFVGRGALKPVDLNETERSFYDYVARYEPYWSEEPCFNSANTLTAAPHLPCPPTDIPMIHRLLDFAVQDSWGKCKTRKVV